MASNPRYDAVLKQRENYLKKEKKKKNTNEKEKKIIKNKNNIIDKRL